MRSLPRILRSVSNWRPLRSREGVTAIEYALIALLVTLVIVGGVAAMGGSLTTIFRNVASGFSG